MDIPGLIQAAIVTFIGLYIMRSIRTWHPRSFVEAWRYIGYAIIGCAIGALASGFLASAGVANGPWQPILIWGPLISGSALGVLIARWFPNSVR